MTIEGELLPSESAATLIDQIRVERRRRWEQTELARMSAKGKPPKNDAWKARYKDPPAADAENLPTLPENWVWISVADIGGYDKNAIVDGPFGSNLRLSDYVAGGTVPVLTTKNLGGDYSDVRYITKEKLEELKRSAVRAGDILMAKIGSCGKTGVYPDYMPTGMIPANLLKVTVNRHIDRDYVLHYFESNFFLKALASITRATAQPAFGVSNFRKLPLPLAPASQQRLVVDAIETQLTRLNAAVADLKHVQANLKRYRASVLKAAVEGRLVPTDAELARQEGRSYEPAAKLLERILGERRRRWDEDERAKMAAKGKTPKDDKWRAKYKEPDGVDTSELPQLPEGWSWATLGTLISVRGGFAFRSKDYCDEGTPLIRQGDLVGGRIDLSRAKRLPPSYLQEYASYTVLKGDLLVGMSGSIGKVAFYDDDEPALQNQRTGLIQINGPIHRAFIAFLLESVERQLLRKGKGVAVQNISGKDIEASVVPVPPLCEMNRITDAIEAAVSVIVVLEDLCRISKQRTAALRQSILKSAFSGRLTRLESTTAEGGGRAEQRVLL